MLEQVYSEGLLPMEKTNAGAGLSKRAAVCGKNPHRKKEEVRKKQQRKGAVTD